MPNLRSLRAYGSWLMSEYGLPTLGTLLSTRTERLSLDFSGHLKAIGNIPGCIIPLSRMAPNLVVLKVQFKIDYAQIEDGREVYRTSVRSMSEQICPSFVRFKMLRLLQLPSLWDPLDTLKSLQGLSNLRLLNLSDLPNPNDLFNSPLEWDDNSIRIEETSNGPFPALRCLLMKGTDTSLVQIFESYFPQNHALSALVIQVEKGRDDDDGNDASLYSCIKVISKQFPRLRSLFINTHTFHAPRPMWTHMKPLSPCSDLRRLTITDCALSSADLVALSKIFTKLEDLDIVDGRAVHALCENPDDQDIKTGDLEGITLDSLETVALNLPNLSYLRLTIVASDTSGLTFSPHAFQKLAFFRLSCSFINMYLWSSNDERGAACFLSSVLPVGCYFSVDDFITGAFSLEGPSDDYNEAYETFANRFNDKVNDGVELRLNERARLSHLGLFQEETTSSITPKLPV